MDESHGVVKIILFWSTPAFDYLYHLSFSKDVGDVVTIIWIDSSELELSTATNFYASF